MNTPADPAVIVALTRTQPDPDRVARYQAEFLAHTTDEAAYWCEMAVHFHGSIAAVHDAHVRSCTTQICPTCAALSEAIAAYDSFDHAEAARHVCGQDYGSDHFSIDCVYRRPGGAR